MRVFITGIAGFIGSHLADRLLAEGHTVCGVDNFTTGAERNLPGDISFAEGDIQALISLDGADLVIHCAASYKDSTDWASDVETNVYGTANIARLARESEIPVFYPQTVLPPITSYAISKITGEQYLHLAEVPVTVFRLANVYGPRSVSGPIPAMYRKISQRQPCVAVKDTTRGFVYVQDLVAFITGGLQGDQWRQKSQTFDLAAKEETPITDLPLMIGNALGVKARIQLRERSPDDVPAYKMKRLNWGKLTPLRDGIRQTVAWYEEHGLDESYTHLQLAR